MWIDHLTIVGVGLIGGSVGLAARSRGLVGRITGVGRDRANLEAAVRVGAIDDFTTDLAEGVRPASVVVFCTPVDRIAEQVIEASRHCDRGTILTDTGSTKAGIVARVHRELRDGAAFVGAHPLAGSEKRGAEHGRADLFVDRLTVVTTTPLTSEAACQNVIDFWTTLGSRVCTMSPEDHDEALATTSHLPHVVASALAGGTDPNLLPLAAGGFRDTTRIAGSDPALWAAIFQANRTEVLHALERFTARVDQFRCLLDAGDTDGMVRWLSEGKQVRDALGN